MLVHVLLKGFYAVNSCMTQIMSSGYVIMRGLYIFGIDSPCLHATTSVFRGRQHRLLKPKCKYANYDSSVEPAEIFNIF